MIYFIVTTSIYNNCPLRRQQYIIGITKLKETVAKHLTDYKIILVENNGKRATFLDDLDCEVYYTNNNASIMEKGSKELKDVIDCTNHYKIPDDCMIVKMTGRYILADESEFILAIAKNSADCVIRYGPYFAPVDHKMKDCITGLIGMRCRFLKQIEFPGINEVVEWKWASVTYLIDDDKIHRVNQLGIHICPSNHNYFLV
jgi:hypothetical protein